MRKASLNLGRKREWGKIKWNDYLCFRLFSFLFFLKKATSAAAASMQNAMPPVPIRALVMPVPC